MSSIYQDPRTGIFYVRFRHSGNHYDRSLKTRDPSEARDLHGGIRETLLKLERGYVTMPDDADPGVWILTDGRRSGKEPKLPTVLEVFARYRKHLEKASKAHSTAYTERIHLNHLEKHLDGTMAFCRLTRADCQRYIDKRSRDKYRGKAVSSDTIHKEIVTLRGVWGYAKREKIVAGDPPTLEMSYAKSEGKPPFRSFLEVQRITRGKPNPLWESVFLSVADILEVLEHVRHKDPPWLYPGLAFAAWTGARRSEIMRSELSDLDFSSRCVVLRERKRVHSKSLTYRIVPMHKRLEQTLQAWIQTRDHGNLTFGNISRSQASWHFGEAMAGSKWQHLGGYHVFRHSFASNLAAAGVDQTIIDRWMGHQTEEQRRRYQHLFPAHGQRAIHLLDGLDGILS